VNILLTGYTGNVGLEIARHLAKHRIHALVRDPSRAPATENVFLVPGTLKELPDALAPEIEMIIHSAASIAFRAPLAELRDVNVTGTAALLGFAKRCPRLKKFVHVSTTCVAGDRRGRIAETRMTVRPGFINAYEQSKWEAEDVVLSSGLPVEIARLAIVAGSEANGFVRRPGALHSALFWLYRGLVPMVPGTAESRVDLISTEFAAREVALLTCARVQPGRIVHATMGDSAPRLGELLDFLAGQFAARHQGWARGSIVLPDIVDATTFELFEAAVRQSGDALFKRVSEDARSFLPGLLYPRTFAASLAEEAAPADWRTLTGRVFEWLFANEWGRQPQISHAA